MALAFKLWVCLAATFVAMSMQAKAMAKPLDYSESKLSIAERLQSIESSNCWDSMLALHSCLGEVVMFFLNGETYIGPACCRAVRTILHDCRSAMLGTIGFTAEESDVLSDYCLAAEIMIPPPPPPPPPPSE